MLEFANSYFENEVLHNSEWLEADAAKRNRALKQAGNMLYPVFKRYHPVKKPLPMPAIFEQAHFLLRKDDTVRMAEMGVVTSSVSGITTNASKTSINEISPNVYSIILADSGSRVGSYGMYPRQNLIVNEYRTKHPYPRPYHWR